MLLRVARLLACVVLVGFSGVAGAVPPSPSEHLGRPVSSDFKLADWSEVSAYYRRLAAESPRVQLGEEGKTTEGREFLVAVISSEANLRNLDRLKAHARTIADPRGKTPAEREQALREGKVFLAITPTMHSTEVAGTEMAMELAYRLATSDEEPWKSARENIVVVLPPTLNPDGLDLVSAWYRKTVNTPHEGAALTRLYQLYTGHDNNRDWFMLTQAETRIMSRLLYKEWLPQIYWDVHQQGEDGERLVLPPYRDPLNPNLDPSIVAAINLVGTRAVLDMTREGFTGVASGGAYDMWWHGGNRSVPVRHNMVSILTEGASANLASPVFKERAGLKLPQSRPYQPSNSLISPWPGGWWRVKDIANYELAFARSLLATINREPRFWLSNTMEAADRAIAAGRGDGVRAWIIPSDNRDPAAVRRLVEALLQAGIELHVAQDGFAADARNYPAGSIVIRRDQPWSAHVKDLFDIQRYPEGAAPYDVAGWSLPLLLGVRRVEVMESLDAVAVRRVESTDLAIAAFRGDPRIERAGERAMSLQNSATWAELARRLAAGERQQLITEGPLTGIVRPMGAVGAVPVPPEAVAAIDRMPRIGIYAPWSANMDEGWLRWAFDAHRIPFVRVRNEMLRAGKLADLVDVLIIADATPSALENGRPIGSVPDQFAGGLAPEGSVAIEDFVRGGGTLVTFRAASKWAIDQFQIPLTDVTNSDDAKGFNCPGSVLRGVPEPHLLNAGLPESIPLMFAGGSGWTEKQRTSAVDSAVRKTSATPVASTQVMLRYASRQLLLSGYIARSSVLEGSAAWVRCSVGRGRVHVFGFQPHYRGWSEASLGLLFRAMLLDERTVADPG
jgi:hypothetical protein